MNLPIVSGWVWPETMVLPMKCTGFPMNLSTPSSDSHLEASAATRWRMPPARGPGTLRDAEWIIWGLYNVGPPR